jgi:hypothetical protein
MEAVVNHHSFPESNTELEHLDTQQDEYSIPREILEDMEDLEGGRCTLFLGAGASQGAQTDAGRKSPSGDELSLLIAEQFLGDRTWILSLENAASLAIAKRRGNLDLLQEFIKDRLVGLKPTPAHKKITWFTWRALVTTNYDSLIEEAYKDPRRAQRLFTILRERDLPKVGRGDADFVTLLKPHGCISQPDLMCLSSENIHQAKQQRRLLFSYIEMLHVEGPVIYVGYSLRDVHILDMIYDLNERLGDNRRPIIFVTQQDIAARAEIESQWFEDKLRARYLPCGFDRFMAALSRQKTPAIGPSMIVEQMSPCRVLAFGNDAFVSYKVHEAAQGAWECWLKYSISSDDGFAGFFFETKADPINISTYDEIKFEINISKEPRRVELLEAFKLEGYDRTYPCSLDIKNLIGKGWVPVRTRLDEYNVEGMDDVHKMPLRRIVIADHGKRVDLNREYKIGLRKVEFQKFQ